MDDWQYVLLGAFWLFGPALAFMWLLSRITRWWYRMKRRTDPTYGYIMLENGTIYDKAKESDL